MKSGILDEAYERLHPMGPEWGGERGLSNHGPMAVEVLVRRGHADQVHEWVDDYIRRLDEMPGRVETITGETWREALGDGRRIGDWAAYFTRQASEEPWRDLLALWWPRLLPGIAAGATHGVIRTAHAVRTLLAGDESPPALTELAHGLAFWAARSHVVPGVPAPAGAMNAGAALDRLPPLADQSGGIADRFGRLAGVPGWPAAVAALRAPADPEEARAGLADLVDAATMRYFGTGHASPVLLIHTATAPNAVLHSLPALPRDLWAPSFSAAWAAVAAITSAYAPVGVAFSGIAAEPDAPGGIGVVGAAVERAAAHGDEHVIKFTDTAVDAYERTKDPRMLGAADYAAELIAPRR